MYFSIKIDLTQLNYFKSKISTNYVATCQRDENYYIIVFFKLQTL